MEGDRLCWKDAELRLVPPTSMRLEDGDGLLPFKKDAQVLADYQRVFATRPAFPARSILELGMWCGASLVFWSEMLGPERLTGIDLADRGDPDLLAEYRRRTDTVIETHWGVDQADRDALERIVTADGLAPLDLVVDDASHLPGPTERSFDVLFPKVRPGGSYIIEDWCWSYVEPTRSEIDHWAASPPLAPIVLRLAAAMASRPDVVSHVEVLPTLIVVERGVADLGAGFTLDGVIATRPDHRVSGVQMKVSRAARKARRRAARLLRSVRSSGR